MSKTPSEQKLWLKWITVCTVCGFLGFAASICLILTQPNKLVTSVVCLLFGSFWGIAQGNVLSKYLSKPVFWLWASIAGVLINAVVLEHILAGEFGSFTAIDNQVKWLQVLICLAATGAVGSIFQFLVLRQHYLMANRWIIASAMGISIGMAGGREIGWRVASAIIGTPTGDNGLSGLANVMSVIVGGFVGLVIWGTVGCAIYGTVTGGVLVWLLRHPKATNNI